MITISRHTLINKLARLKSCTPVAVDTETYPKMLKKDRNTGEPNDFIESGIVKIGTMGGFIGCSYSNGVNNQLGREDKELVFKAKERTWGKLMDNKIMVVHTPKGQTTPKYYLQILVKSSKRSIFTDGTKIIDYSELKGVLPKHVAPKTQDALDKKVILRDIAIDNIKVIRMLNEKYCVCSDDEMAEMEKIEIRQRNASAIQRVTEIFKTL